jgi:hypothetical protein
MGARRRPPAGAVGALVALATIAGAQPAARPLARLAIVDRGAEIGGQGDRWTPAEEGRMVSIGETVRVEPDAVARLELPWMAVTLSSRASLRFAGEPLLAALLGSGRALVEAEQRPMLKLVSPGAEVRGRGRAVLRVGSQSTTVTCLSGRFEVSSARGSVSLAPGLGCVIFPGRKPSTPGRAPAAPSGLWPGTDPVYVRRGEPLELRWDGRAPGYQVELLPVGAEVVLLQRETEEPRLRLEIPWQGAFRWRVSARDARDIEGLPSFDGLVAVE